MTNSNLESTAQAMVAGGRGMERVISGARRPSFRKHQ
jgi:hypothetical protein